ncbi:MAG TPA: response regulator transcription factor [Anaeromyxobacter sp.]|nr:response regulator transcription factor [Anaeromyxobacter sp.]
MPRILIVEDHEIFRQGARGVLGAALPGATFGEAGDVPQAIARLTSGSWDLLLLDAGLPGRSGLELLQEAHHDWPGTPVLVLSAHAEEELALRAIRLGAAGFLAKSCSSAELVTAVRKILGGGRYITASLSEQLARFVSGERSDVPHDELSPRELQVLKMVARGSTMREIGQALHVSEKTVATYRARVAKKLRLRRLADLVRYAVTHRLVE